MTYTDALHTLFITDDERDPLSFSPPTCDEMNRAYGEMIISASGWRKVFAFSGDEEDRGAQVKRCDLILAALAAVAFFRHLDKERPSVLVGLDARPTGRLLGEVVVRILLALGCSVRYLFITSAPQIMAASTHDGCDAFFYISASHNPIGHNGFKMGTRGGVYDGNTANTLMTTYASLLEAGEASIRLVQGLSAGLDRDTYRSTLEHIDRDRAWSLDCYSRFALITAAKSSDDAQLARFKDSLHTALMHEPIGIVGELNGSARGASIDAPFLSSLGVQVALYHDRPGDVVHAIVPEGENLDLCRSLLEAHYKENQSYVLGYSVDNDGDRGNIVYIDETSGKAKILDAQRVYALALLSELAQSRLKNPTGRLATAVNGPTSMRVDAIARVFGAEVFRSEVGEANVVSLGEQKRSEGWEVPILGEGSNGGNITHPARVRDPINTLVSLVQLLRRREIADLWFTRLTLDLPPRYTLTAIIESLPPFTTTAVSSPSAVMKINCGHGELKRRYEALLASDWIQRASDLEERGFTSYRVYQTEGLECRAGIGEEYRTPPYTGGYKVALCDRDGREQAFLWMRGSKTEPVFRLIADVAGDREETHDYLLAWQRSLIERASTP